jgi:hypothetical protein
MLYCYALCVCVCERGTDAGKIAKDRTLDETSAIDEISLPVENLEQMQKLNSEI